jgi:hypothetical protein
MLCGVLLTFVHLPVVVIRHKNPTFLSEWTRNARSNILEGEAAFFNRKYSKKEKG